ncbi:methyl-accepting chemotaxis protein [Roseobacteraceae bacterium S113]
MTFLKTVKAKVLIFVWGVTIFGMTALGVTLTLGERATLLDKIAAQKGILASVLGFDMVRIYKSVDMQRQVFPNGKLDRLVSTEMPNVVGHEVVDAASEKAFGLASILEWNSAERTFVRISTSARETSGQRAVGGQLSDVETVEALRNGQSANTQSSIGGISFLTAVVPIVATNGVTVGALEVGIPSAEITEKLWTETRISILTIATMMALSGIVLLLAIPRALRPIGEINLAMESIAKGDFTAEVPHTDMKDKVGEIARGLEGFAVELSAANKARDEQSRTQQEAIDASKRTTDVQTRVVADLSNALSRLANGDLDTRIENSPVDPFPEEYEGLRDSFNGAVAKLDQTMQDVLSASSSLQSGAHEIDQAAHDLSSRAEAQASTLEASAAALSQLSVSVSQSSERVSQAEQAGQEARAQAEIGSEVMREAIDAMEKIADGSEQVTQIIRVIDDISFQTNLLALNAGVEAARAGDAGKGFAVVASEVRALAQRTSSSAREIKSLIDESNAQISQGKDLVSVTGERLVEILGQSNEMEAVLKDAAIAAKEQAVALDEITSSINQLDSVTQHNAAMAEETNAAATALNKTAEDMMKSLGQFSGNSRSSSVLAFRRGTPQPSPSSGNWALDAEAELDANSGQAFSGF